MIYAIRSAVRRWQRRRHFRRLGVDEKAMIRAIGDDPESSEAAELGTRPLHRVLSRFFVHEGIDGAGATEEYLHRWELFRLGRFAAVYLHHFVGDDWSRDVHDHPKRFVSIGLAGKYVEETAKDGIVTVSRLYEAPWIRTFPATHRHRLRLPAGHTCWTLVIVGPAVREWGFYEGATWVPWREYVGRHGGHR